jgi:hypothetical protein
MVTYELPKTSAAGTIGNGHKDEPIYAASPFSCPYCFACVRRDRTCSRMNLDEASAAFEVGYESASWFNREYRRFFGQPLIRDIKALRNRKVVAITAA